MTAPVMRDRAEAVLRQEQHLAVPCVRAQRPAVRERDDRALAPVLVVDFRAVSGGDRAHACTPFAVSARRRGLRRGPAIRESLIEWLAMVLAGPVRDGRYPRSVSPAEGRSHLSKSPARVPSRNSPSPAMASGGAPSGAASQPPRSLCNTVVAYRGAGGCVSVPRGPTRDSTEAILAGERDSDGTGKQKVLTTSNSGEETLMSLSRS